MKILLYSEQLKRIQHSGLGKAIKHQMLALDKVEIPYTLNPKDSFDILHINTYFPRSYQMAKHCQKKGIPVVYHAHSTEEDFRNSFHGSNIVAPLFKQWLIQCYNTANHLITPTPYAQAVLESYGRIHPPMTSISNGIDLEQFKPIPHARTQFLELYPYKDSDYIVMGIGLYLERKGLLDFVELAQRLPHIQFIWFGHTDLKLVPAKIRQAVERKLPNLRFAGYVDNSIIRLALQACDLYLFPTWEETEGIPAVEACACQANFIVRDIPVFNPWLIDGVHCHKAQDINGFQALIEQGYQGTLPNYGPQAYAIAQERDLSVIGQALERVYQTVLSKTIE